jgi:hypothetical protein
VISGEHTYTGTISFTLKLTRSNRAPIPEERALAVARDGSVPITLAAGDPDGGAVTFDIADPPRHGTLTGTGATRTYVPAPGYAGADTFTFRATDPEGLSAEGRITLSVVAPRRAGTPVASSAVCVSDLVLHEVRRSGRRIQLAGIADPGLAGLAVQILEDARVVATPTIAADGAFAATASLPPGGSMGPIRYSARLGPLSSRHIRLSRRLIALRTRIVGDDVIVTGRIVGARRSTAGTPVELFTRRQTCGTRYAHVGSARAGRDGRFRARIAKPAGSGRVVLRAESVLAEHGATYSLPHILTLG